MEIGNEHLGGFFTNRFGDRFLYAVNGNAFSQVGARNLYRAHYKESLLQANTLHVIVGSDSGLLIRHIMEQGVPEGSRYLFIEAEPLIPLIRAVIPGLHEAIALVPPGKWEEQAGEFGFDAYTYLERAQLNKSIAVEDGHYPVYREIWADVEQRFDHLWWSRRMQFGTKSFFEKQLDNVAENRHPASLLKGRYSGQSAVILGGGPSLDEVLPWVQERREKLFVIAVSRIARRLMSIGFAPDLFVAVDPHDISFDVSKESLLFEIPLAHANHVHPRLLGQWRAPTLYFGRRYPWPARCNGRDDRDNINGAPPTVTNSALSLAMGMGFAQVLFGGLDLCFSREGYSHAQGSNERKVGPMVTFGSQTVKTNGGWLAETDNSFFLAMTVFKGQAKEATEGGCRLINPAPGAAAIEGIDFVPLSEIVLPNRRPSAITDYIPNQTADSRLCHYRKALNSVRRFQSQVTRVRRLAREALSANSSLFGLDGRPPGDFRFKRRMDRIESELDGRLNVASQLCKVFGMTEFVKFLAPLGNAGWTDERVAEGGRIYYTAYLKGADEILTTLTSAQIRLKSRMMEESPGASLKILAGQWRRDRQPGRVMIWSARHPARPRREEEDLVAALRGEFRQALDETDTAHQRRCAAWAQLRGTTAKAYNFLQNRDLAGLTRLLEGLNKHQGVEAVPLRFLVQGHIAEIEGRLDDAVAAYEQADGGQALEIGLRRLVSIALDLQDLESAFLGVRALVEISPNYLPHLAALARLRGNTKEAIDLYADYLSHAPDDIQAMMKLGMLCKEAGLGEGAETMFRHILARDPGNAAARQLLEESVSGHETARQ